MTGDGNAASTPRARTVAFYLPQFHSIAENDEWWGQGFTEWRNVRRGRPLFPGHDQPRVPVEPLGEYELPAARVMRHQEELARQGGIDAFCYYFYWFAGKRLLERPVDARLADVALTLPFCLSWANENWTRRWDGKSRQVLMGQDYGPRTPGEVFDALLPYLSHPAYLRVGGRLVLLVHRADHLPAPAEYARHWREAARADGLGELHLIASETSSGLDPRALDFDAVAEFPPVAAGTARNMLWPLPGKMSREFSGRMLDYLKIRESYCGRSRVPFVRHRGVMPGWDNTARRQRAATIVVGSTPRHYENWLTRALRAETGERASEGLVFINAWNEWAEGAYLEPDVTNGDAFLRATARAVEAAEWAEQDGAEIPPAGAAVRYAVALRSVGASGRQALARAKALAASGRGGSSGRHA